MEPFPMALVAVALALFAVVAQERPSAAAAEWQRLTDELTPKIVAYRTLPPDERKKQSLAAERAQVLDYFRRFEKSDPDLAWSARVWLATNVTRDALERERDAADELATIAKDSASGEAASRAAIHAADGLLKLGDEEALARMKTSYSARPDPSPAVVSHLENVGRQILVLPGRRFPDLAVTDLAGHAVDWKELRGKVVLVLAFNVLSEPSRQALERTARLAHAHAREPFAVVGISLDVERAALTTELTRLDATFPVDCAGKEWKAPAARELGLEQIPVAWLLDPKGTVVEFRRGPLPPAFDEAVEKAIHAATLAPTGGH
jgi:hypothetical protein